MEHTAYDEPLVEPAADESPGRRLARAASRLIGGTLAAGLVATAAAVGTSVATAAPAAAAQTVNVAVSDVPTQTLLVTVNPGDSVQWTNTIQDKELSTTVSLLGIGLVTIKGVLHTEISFSVNGRDIGLAAGATSEAIPFTTAGAFPYTVNYGFKPEVTSSVLGISLDYATQLLTAAITQAPPLPVPGLITVSPLALPNNVLPPVNIPSPGDVNLPGGTTPVPPAVPPGSGATPTTPPTGSGPTRASQVVPQGSGTNVPYSGPLFDTRPHSSANGGAGENLGATAPIFGVLSGYGSTLANTDTESYDAAGTSDQADRPGRQQELGLPALIAIVLLSAVTAGLVRTYVVRRSAS